MAERLNGIDATCEVEIVENLGPLFVNPLINAVGNNSLPNTDDNASIVGCRSREDRPPLPGLVVLENAQMVPL